MSSLQIEGSFYELWLIPNLAYMMRKSINVFNITFYADKVAPHPHINRLFPHGQTYLLTDSFLLLHPREATRFLRWYRFKITGTKAPGTWRLCTRPRIREFLFDLLEEKSEDEGFPFMQMYESLWYIIPTDYPDDDDLEDDVELITDIYEKPVRCMNRGVTGFDCSVGRKTVPDAPINQDQLARNDEILAEWYAGWGMTQVEKYRRFQIISGGRPEAGKAWERKWSHVSDRSDNI